MRKTAHTTSKVSDRLDWLIGQMVEIYPQVVSGEGERPIPFIAVYQDTLPLGSEYFFKFRLENGTIRLIRTRAVLEIRTLR